MPEYHARQLERSRVMVSKQLKLGRIKVVCVGGSWGMKEVRLLELSNNTRVVGTWYLR